MSSLLKKKKKKKSILVNITSFAAILGMTERGVFTF